MNDPHDNKDDDTIIIKPMMFTGSILLSAGAGLIAGLLICWLIGCQEKNDSEERQALGAVIEVGYDVEATHRSLTG